MNDVNVKGITLKQAVKAAVSEISELFESQMISGILLEEVDRPEDDGFLITIGFDRPTGRNGFGVPGSALSSMLQKERVYKIVRLTANGDILSIKDRMLEKK